MPTDQRPGGLPPFFFELDHSERLLLSCANFQRGQIDLVYRERGRGRSANERSDHMGHMDELHSWLTAVQELGDRLNAEYAVRAAEKVAAFDAGDFTRLREALRAITTFPGVEQDDMMARSMRKIAAEAYGRWPAESHAADALTKASDWVEHTMRTGQQT